MISFISQKEARGERYLGDADFSFTYFDCIFLSVYMKFMKKELANNIVEVSIRKGEKINRENLQKTPTSYTR